MSARWIGGVDDPHVLSRPIDGGQIGYAWALDGKAETMLIQGLAAAVAGRPGLERHRVAGIRFERSRWMEGHRPPAPANLTLNGWLQPEVRSDAGAIHVLSALDGDWTGAAALASGSEFSQSYANSVPA